MVSGSMPPTSVVDAVDQACVRAHARHDLGHGRGSECVTRSGDERRVPVERRHDVVGRDLLLDRLAIGRLHPVRERRDERDERDPDHQRRRGRRRPARVPAGVLSARASGHAIRDHAGELHRPLRFPSRHRPSQPHDEDDRQEQRIEQRAADEGEHAARSRSRPPRSVAQEPVREEQERPEQDGEDERGPTADRAADHRERTHDVLREHRDAEEQQQDAGRDREQAIARAELVREHRAGQDRDRADDHEHADPGHERRQPGLRERRTFSDRRDRRHPGRPDRGKQPRRERDADTHGERDDHRARCEHAVRRRQLDPEGAEEPFDPLRQEHTETEADERSEQPDDERLEDDRAENLPPRGADRPQRRELARALGDGDRERVEDDERADEERDAGEDEEEVAEDGRELVDLVHRVGRLRRRAHDLRGVRQHGRDRRDELVLRDAFDRRDRDRVVLALPVEQLLRGRNREHREARIPEAVEAAVAARRRRARTCASAGASRSRPCRRPRSPWSSAVPASMTTSFADGGPTALEDVQRIELRERRSRCRCRTRRSARPRS